MEMHEIIDGHVHSLTGGTAGVRAMLAVEKQYGYACCNYLSCECMDDLTQNALGIYLKALAPENYIFGGLHYRSEYSFAGETEALHAIGFDGMKMVENKPTMRKILNMPANDARYDGFYSYLEASGMPLLAHIADPEEMWDEKRVPGWARKKGWAYTDGSYMEKDVLLDEMLDVLQKHPGMRVILAHFFFLSAELERLDALLEQYPNMYVDITSGTEMYFNFSQRRDDWRAFFIKHQNRIVYGTDNMNFTDADDIETMDTINRLQPAFLAQEGEIPAFGKHCLGIALPEDAQHKITRGNFERLVGPSPRALDKPAAARYLQNRLDTLPLKEEERGILLEVLAFIT